MPLYSVLAAIIYGVTVSAVLRQDKAPKTPYLSAPVLLCLVALHAAIVRFSLYFMGYPLSYDEATLHLATHPWKLSRLLEPLAFEQTAAPGFIALSKAVAALWGSHEYALRLIPLIAGLCVLVLIYKAAFSLWSRPAGAVALILAGHHFDLIAFSATYKQYETDALCTAAVMAVAARYRSMQKAESEWYQLLLLGVIAIAISQTAIISLLALIGFIVVSNLRTEGLCRMPRWNAGFRPSMLVALMALWVVWLALLYFSLYAPVSASPYMRRFWADRFLSLSGFTEWRYAAYSLMKPLPGSPAVLIVLCGLGLYACFRKRDWALLALLALPLVLTSTLSVLHRYPVASRLWLFLAPVVIVSVSVGLTFLWHVCLSLRVPRKAASAAAGIGVSLLLFFQAQDHLGIVHHSIARIREASTGPTRGASARRLAAIMTAAPRCDSVYIASRSIPSWFFYTSQVQSATETDRRFAFIQRVFHRESVAWSDAEIWQLRFPNPATWLVVDSGCGKEVYGLASGTPNRATPVLERKALPGWAENEVNRVAANATDRYWLYLDHTGEFEWKAMRREAQERGYAVTCHTLPPEFVTCEVSQAQSFGAEPFANVGSGGSLPLRGR